MFVHDGRDPDGHGRARRCGGDAGRRRAPAHGCAPIIRRPICCMRRCAGVWATMSPRRARSWRPTACASITASRCRPRREDLAVVAEDVNRRIRGNAEVATRLMTPDEAVKQGALALFGEKYGEEVRVVSHGRRGRGRQFLDRALRRDPCAADRRYRPVQDRGRGAVAAGVRRIEALTGAARRCLCRRAGPPASARRPRHCGCSRAELPQRVAGADRGAQAAGARADRGRASASPPAAAAADDSVKDVAGVKLAARLLDGVPAKELKGMADALKQQIGSGIVALVARSEDRASLVVGVTSRSDGAFQCRRSGPARQREPRRQGRRRASRYGAIRRPRRQPRPGGADGHRAGDARGGKAA